MRPQTFFIANAAILRVLYMPMEYLYLGSKQQNWQQRQQNGNTTEIHIFICLGAV